MRYSKTNGYIASVALVLCAIMGGAIFRLWVVNHELALQKERQPVIYQKAQLDTSFVDVSRSSEERETFLQYEKDLLQEKENFIAVDLELMTVTLYEKGNEIKVLPIQSKGREGSWWETPTGRYSVLLKSSNHFSSIGKVWMPWSVQFYGNFFIHGWPYYEDGTPVSKTYSGGCVRLESEDAKEVFDFASKGMPILVFDRESKPALLPSIESQTKDLHPPVVSSDAVMIADIDTGELLVNKRADKVLPIASLVKLMTGVVASELVYLEREIYVSAEMLIDPIQSYPLQVGKKYRAFDLLYPMLMQSSNGAARTLAGFIGENKFVEQMNEKAKTLGMAYTTFVDPSGLGAENFSTLKDLAKLAKYIYEKRKFLFDISLGRELDIFGINELKDVKNYNEFINDERIMGSKNGETVAAGQTLLSVWRFKTSDNRERHMIIAVLGSKDRRQDGQILVNWLTENFDLQ